MAFQVDRDREKSIIKVKNFVLKESCYWAFHLRKNSGQAIFSKIMESLRTGHLKGCLEIAYHHSSFDDVDSIMFFCKKTPYGNPVPLGHYLIKLLKEDFCAEEDIVHSDIICKSHVGKHLHKLKL